MSRVKLSAILAEEGVLHRSRVAGGATTELSLLPGARGSLRFTAFAYDPSGPSDSMDVGTLSRALLRSVGGFVDFANSHRQGSPDLRVIPGRIKVQEGLQKAWPPHLKDQQYVQYGTPVDVISNEIVFGSMGEQRDFVQAAKRAMGRFFDVIT